MSKFPVLSGVLNSGERAEGPQNCLQSSAQILAWEKLGWTLFPVDYSDPLERLLAHALDPETCAQCGTVLKIERFCRTTLMETCPVCDEPEYDA